MRKWWRLGTLSVCAATGCAALLDLRDDYEPSEVPDAASTDARLADGASTPSDGAALTDASVTDADADAESLRFCERAARDGGAVLFCADFDEGEAGAGFDSTLVQGDAGFALATTPNQSPPRSLMVTLPASRATSVVGLKKDVALATSTATVSFAWRVESLADAPDGLVATVSTVSPNLQLGIGLIFDAGTVSLCYATPVAIVPGVWHTAEVKVLSGSMSCELDGKTAVLSTNGPVAIVKLSLGPERYPAPLIDGAVALQPAVKIFFDDVLVQGP